MRKMEQKNERTEFQIRQLSSQILSEKTTSLTTATISIEALSQSVKSGHLEQCGGSGKEEGDEPTFLTGEAALGLKFTRGT